MITRDRYLKRLIETAHNGMPKVITGLRRCGKSYLLKEIYRSYLSVNGVPEKNIISIDLDDLKNLQYRDPLALDAFIRSKLEKNEMNYVFIDEIQLVNKIINPIYTGGKHILAKESDKDTAGFVELVLGLSKEKNVDLYVTGSNSKMLSTDIITEFRDKATNINLYPLSFSEYFGYVGGSPNDALYQYMMYGGMPLAVLENRPDMKRVYLKNLFETTYFKDIIERNNLSKSESLDELANIISSSCGNFLNANKIADTYRSVKKETMSSITVSKYLDFLKDAYLINEAKRYDIKGRKEIGSLKKYYFADTGLRNARLNFAFGDEGQMLENVIYNELISSGYNVNVGQLNRVGKDASGNSIRKDYEIDFIAKKDYRQYYIQVSADISNKETLEREIRPFVNIKDAYQKILVVNKPIEETRDENGFTVIGAADFLLRFIK